MRDGPIAFQLLTEQYQASGKADAEYRINQGKNVNRLGLRDKNFQIVTDVAGGKEWVQAGRERGYSDSYSRVLRSRLMKKPEVVQMIDEI